MRGFDAPFIVQHRNLAGVACALAGNAIALGRFVLVALGTEQAAEESLVGRLCLCVLILIDIANIIDTLRAIAVFHRKSDAVQREADPAPGAIEGFVALDNSAAADAFDKQSARL